MQLPNIIESIEQLGLQLGNHIATNQLVEPLFVGVHTGGAWIAEKLHQQLAIDTPLYSVDISFYRDDFTRNGLHPQVKGSELPDSIEDRHIILIDDVIMSGRTTRAAINELFDYGRPASITLACLIDIGQRELPFQPDIVAVRLQLASNERIKISGPDPLDISIVNNH